MRKYPIPLLRVNAHLRLIRDFSLQPNSPGGYAEKVFRVLGSVTLTILAMRLYLLALLLIPFLLPVQPELNLASAQTASHPRSTGNQDGEVTGKQRMELAKEIEGVLTTQVRAWNQGNVEEFMQGYWRSPKLEFYSGGSITLGWEQTLAHYKQRYQSEGKEMGKLEFKDLNIDLLSQQAAVVTGKYQLTLSDGKTPHGIFTLIFKRMPAGWKIVHDHTSAAGE